MNKWMGLASLALLDDAGSLELPPRALDELTRTATRAATPGANYSADAAPRVVPTVAPANAKAAPRVFSSRPSLRQMMDEYNRRSARVAPIKCHSPVEGRDVFQFQNVDLIQIPNIPGKILRPARKPERDADA